MRERGYVALKSIVAYRTGLDIREWPPEEAHTSFREARRDALEKGTLRLAHKALLDTLLHVAFAEAARQEVPVQFHTGYGDTDADMLLANPLHLRAMLERREYRGMPVVVLHGCYPYTRQGGYLAAVYEHVYLDLSYGIPFLGYSEMRDLTRAAFGVAPISKLHYSSDGVGVAELHWAGARHGRRVIGQVLGELAMEVERARSRPRRRARPCCEATRHGCTGSRGNAWVMIGRGEAFHVTLERFALAVHNEPLRNEIISARMAAVSKWPVSLRESLHAPGAPSAS